MSLILVDIFVWKAWLHSVPSGGLGVNADLGVAGAAAALATVIAGRSARGRSTDLAFGASAARAVQLKAVAAGVVVVAGAVFYEVSVKLLLL